MCSRSPLPPIQCCNEIKQHFSRNPQSFHAINIDRRKGILRCFGVKVLLVGIVFITEL